ncbi:STAS domain-containing protein [bacterium]|nr:STAS domain-containing protein [bacterium]
MAEFRIVTRPIEKRNTILLEISGWVDLASSLLWEKTMRGYTKTGEECMVLDLKYMEYINTRGLGSILVVQKYLDDHGGSLILVGPTERVQQSIEITGVSRVIPTYETLEEALQENSDLKQR